jgi:hypothetical protein
VTHSNDALKDKKKAKSSEDLQKYSQISFFADICICENGSNKLAEKITTKTSKFWAPKSVLMDFKAIWVRTLGRLVNIIRSFSSNLLLPSSESFQSKLLSLNCGEPEVEASDAFQASLNIHRSHKTIILSITIGL